MFEDCSRGERKTFEGCWRLDSNVEATIELFFSFFLSLSFLLYLSILCKSALPAFSKKREVKKETLMLCLAHFQLRKYL